jgi:simple sugar transport system ATP-binding protein
MTFENQRFFRLIGDTGTLSYALEARGIVRTYGQVEALRGADFTVKAGEVTALIGDNGAGKSTLVRILSGTEKPDSGSIFIDGEEVFFDSPADARDAGVETVFQDLALCPHLSAVQNLFLGREIPRAGLLGKLGFMDNEKMKQISADAFRDLGATVRSLTASVGSMSGGQRQSIAVARSAAWANKVLFFDEPTAALGVVQKKNVLDLVRRVRDKGIGVVFISHSMPEVLEISDQVQIMRRGVNIANYKTSKTNLEELVGAMTGRLDEVNS